MRFLKSPYLWMVAIRLLFMWLVPRHLQGDAVDYEQIATNLVEGRGFSRCFQEPFIATAQRPPLYPIALAVFYLTGINHDYGPIFLNIIFDGLSMFFAQMWGKQLKLGSAKAIPWVIALCPLLVTYGMYPTTENMSITLFFAALALTYKKRAVASGLVWGLLSLCRSYFLLFPILLALASQKIRVLKTWSKKAWALLLLFSFVAPGVWMVRNYIELDRVAFSQTSTVGWQSYQGICVSNFDWWNTQHVAHMYTVPVLTQMISGHCANEDQMASYDNEVKELVLHCILDRPLESARNVVIKGINLFTNWGLFMPYNRVPYLVQHLVNGLLCVLWFCISVILWRNRSKIRGTSAGSEVIRFSLLNIIYIVAVTIPFAVDARYLLAPFLTLLIGILDWMKTPGKIFSAGLSGSAHPAIKG